MLLYISSFGITVTHCMTVITYLAHFSLGRVDDAENLTVVIFLWLGAKERKIK